MSDTAKRGVPVRFCFLTGGTKPHDVVNLADGLDTAIAPFLTTEEQLARSGRQVTDDYDWEAALAEIRAEENADEPTSPAETDSPTEPDWSAPTSESPQDTASPETPQDDAPADTP